MSEKRSFFFLIVKSDSIAQTVCAMKLDFYFLDPCLYDDQLSGLNNMKWKYSSINVKSKNVHSVF
jgi:hypothetical protein